MKTITSRMARVLALSGALATTAGIAGISRAAADPPSHAPAWGWQQVQHRHDRGDYDRDGIPNWRDRDDDNDRRPDWLDPNDRSRIDWRHSGGRWGDLDRDGIRNDRDWDIDGDHVSNRRDRFPFDRRRH